MNTKAMQNNVADISKLVHPKCIACGHENKNGLHLEFEITSEGSVTASFQLDDAYQGYPGILHGGVIAMILDSAMCNCMFARGLTAVTVEISTKFRKPVMIRKPAKATAMITRASHSLYLLEAQIIQGGKVKAIAKGKFYDQS